MASTLQTLAHELALAVRTLQPALASPAAFQGLALRLGWHVEQIPPPILALGAELGKVESAMVPFFGDTNALTDTQVTALVDAKGEVRAGSHSTVCTPNPPADAPDRTFGVGGE